MMWPQYHLCHSFQAEEIMKKIEKEEVLLHGRKVFFKSILTVLLFQEELAYEEPDKKFYHLCIVNLVIG